MTKTSNRQNIFGLCILFASILAGSVAFGINIIALPAILIKHNVSPFLIGIATAAEICASIFISFYLSKIIAKLGALRSSLLFSLLYALNIAVIFFYQNFSLWLAICVINGFCWFGLYIIRQSWINILIKNEVRSIALALITTTFCVGIVIGAFVVKNLGAQNYTSFLTSSSLIAISGLILLLARRTRPRNIDAHRIKISEFFRQQPRIATARLLLEIQCGCLVLLSVVFGAKVNISPENSGMLIGAFMASGFCDLYAGFLVNKYDRYKMILTGFVGCLVIMSCGLFFYHSFVALLAIYFFFGCFTALIFVASITIANESFPKEKLIASNSTFQSIASIGQLLGAFIGGALISLFDFYGFFITIILANIGYFIFIFLYEKKRQKN